MMTMITVMIMMTKTLMTKIMTITKMAIMIIMRRRRTSAFQKSSISGQWVELYIALAMMIMIL